jgi:FtsZ-binding cell division protein ZapB
MLTFGSEAIDQINIDAWAKNNYQWLCDNFGGKENVISAVLHVDERTPHIHAIVIPMDEKGKLNYRKYLGGSKYRLSEIQDSYHEQVGELHNLQRGSKGSKATHTDIVNFYSMVNESVAPVTLPDPEQKTGFFKKAETAVEYQERVTPIIQHAHSVSVAKEKENELLKKRIADIEHLQEGVVPLDLYEESVEKCHKLEQQLARAERNEKFNHNWALEEQKKFEELERSLPQKIADAVAEATSVLQEQYDSLKTRYMDVKQKYMPLVRAYSDLQREHDTLKKEHQALQNAAAHIHDLIWENKLMYTLLSTLNQAQRIDKCRAAHAKGDISIEERLIYGKENSQRANELRKTSVQKQAKKGQSYEL